MKGRLWGPASPSVRGAPSDVTQVIFVSAFLCPDSNLLGGSHVCPWNTVTVLPSNFPCLSLYKWKPTNQSCCQQLAHPFDSFPKKSSNTQLSGCRQRIVTSLGSTKVCAEAYITSRTHVYLPGKGLQCWNYINTISTFSFQYFLELVKKGSIILKLNEIVVILEYYYLGIFIIPMASEVVSQLWKTLLGKPNHFPGLYFLKKTKN